MSSGHATGMAGEFFVMEQLFRRGYEPALTLGNAKHVDIFAHHPTKRTKRVTVKATINGGKWNIGKSDLYGEKDLVFVFLRYSKFAASYAPPDVWVVPAPRAWDNAASWLKDTWAIYYSGKYKWPDLDKFKDAWHHI